MNRRGFVRAATAAVGVGLLACEDPSLTQLDPQFAKGGNGGGKGGGNGGSDPVARHPLNVPSVRTPTNFDLTAAPCEVDLGGGNMSTVWGYNGEFPGPTLLVNQGDAASVNLFNGLGDETITHWHGMVVDTPNDGHPQEAIPPGGTYSYDFPIIQRATMNWYHPHPHEKTGEQVAMGLAGAFIIRDQFESSLGLPGGTREVPLIIRDAAFDKSGAMDYKPRSGGFEGRTPLVNGTLDPMLSVSTAVYRLRILNGCNARILRLAFDSGVPFVLIGNDGGLLESSVVLEEIEICPAERLDVLVDLRPLEVGSTVMLRDLDAGWDLLELRVENQVNDDSTNIPVALSTIEPLQMSNVSTVREFSFDGMSKINGRLYDMERIDFRVPFGDTELWRFTTNGNAPHPVHVHGAYYQVVSRSGGRGQLFPWEAGWKDSVLLHDGETVEVLIRFGALPQAGARGHGHDVELRGGLIWLLDNGAGSSGPAHPGDARLTPMRGRESLCPGANAGPRHPPRRESRRTSARESRS
jgi:FtsP/CotA-like multicopper oxidase with cupredoxin domain